MNRKGLIIDIPGVNSKGKTNKITTARYTMLTFLPKCLIIQFLYINHVYFLIFRCPPGIKTQMVYYAIFCINSIGVHK